VARARARTLVGVMIETRAGVANAARIAAVPGLDLVFLGTGDLMLAHSDDADPAGATEAACAEVLAACRAVGLPCGAFTPDAAAALARRAEGHAFTVIASDLPEIMGAFAGAARRFNGEG
jgi:2-dehydro-3-deoxyglucarate aldolase/4-hydroxy-2-oxoheptanedioate aldolase